MKWLPLCVLLCLGTSALQASDLREKPNVLLICVDDLRPELACFGRDYIHSPQIDALASRGRPFLRHYVQAPTCGASRFTLLTGRYGPDSNQALFRRARDIRHPSLPAWFRRHGYTTVSVGKVSHHPGGLGGKDWNDPGKPEMPESWDRSLLPAGAWLHPRGWMHGLANGEIRNRAGDMDVFQAFAGPDDAYPDGISTAQALSQMEELASTDAPFFLAVGILRPHLPFGAPAKYLELYRDTRLPPIPHPEKPAGKTTWHRSGEFMKYHRWGRDPNEDSEFADEVRRHYAACVSFADAQVGRLLERLDALDLTRNTIVVLWGDHGWHLGEHAVWGKHTLFEESLRSPLVIAYPGIPEPGTPTASIVETIDLFPTLCDLAGLELPDFLDGVSLVPILSDPNAPGHPAVSYQRGQQTVRSGPYRLIRHPGHRELYDLSTPAGHTRNLAETHPEIVERLENELDAKWKADAAQ